MSSATNFIGVIVLLLVCSTTYAHLSSTFYARSCPDLQTIVRTAMTQAVNTEQRMGASILRLFFRDCFVNGCDASNLLDDTVTFTGEKSTESKANLVRGYEVIDTIKASVEAACNATVSCADILALAARDGVVLGCDTSILLYDTATFTGEKNTGSNGNSIRGYEVIDTIKASAEAACNATVSCADILALAARDGVVLLSGPTWNMPLVRRDARTAKQTAANINLPLPTDSLATLISAFSRKGLNARERGQAQCTAFRNHIYNDTNIDFSFATLRQRICPRTGGDINLAPLDIGSPVIFNNNYYKNLVIRRGLLHSDQELFNNGTQDRLVKSYSTNNALFQRDFAAAISMIKM